MKRLSALLVLFTAFAASPAQAAPIVAGNTSTPSTAIQDITLLPGTPFNPTGDAILLKDLFGIGDIGYNRDTQVGDSIVISSLTGGQYFGFHPLLGNYVFGNIAPLTGADFSGRIDNVVQDPTDPGFATGQASSFRSGDFSFGGNSFGFLFLSGPAAGIALYTDPTVPFSFTSHFDGLPPSNGTVLQSSGVDFLNVTFDGQVVATSSNRRIILSSVPEPTSMALLTTGLFGFGVMRRRTMGLIKNS